MRGPPQLVAAAAIVCGAAFPTTALAHQAGLSRGVYTFGAPGRIEASIAFARPDFTSAIEASDEATRTPEGTAALAPKIRATFLDALHVRAGGAPCAGELVSATPDQQDGIVLDARFECPAREGASPVDVEIDVAFLGALVAGHRHLARVEGGSPSTEEILFTGKSTLVARAPAAWSAARAGASFASAVGAGFRGACGRIAAPLFAVTAALPSGPRRPSASRAAVVVAATAMGFVAGAYAALAGAARGLTPSATVVGALAAAAVAFVAVENVVDASDRLRPALGATFGVVLGAHAGPAVGGGVVGGAGAIAAFGALAAGLVALGRKLDDGGARARLVTRGASALVAAAAVALFVKTIV